MKDIFEMLNDASIDEADLLEIPADDLERQMVKAAVRQRIEGERKMEQRARAKKITKRMRGAVACGAAVILGITGLGMAFPTYAKEVPVVGDIFRYFDNGRTGQYDLYQKSASEIHMTKEGDGIRVTLNEGVYDGSTLFLTYTVKTDQDMGDDPILNSNLRFDRKLGINGWSGSSSFKQVEEGVYVGMDTYTIQSDQEKTFDTVPFTWSVEGMMKMGEGDREPETLGCNLHFNVSLSTVSGDVQKLSASAAEPVKGTELTITELNRTSINTTLKYTLKTDPDINTNLRIDWKVEDELGGQYEALDMGSTGGEKNGVWNQTFQMNVNGIDPGAAKLILTPVFYYAEPAEDGEIMGGGVAVDSDGNETELIDVPRAWSEAYLTEPGSIEIPLK